MPKENAATTPENVGNLLSAIFKAWDRNSILYLILRNYENLPQSTGNDVDVLVASKHVHKAEQIMVAAARECGYVMHNRVEFATLSCFFFHPESLCQIQIDLFSRLAFHSFEILPAERVLSNRQARGIFYIPHPVHEALIDLLTRLLYVGEVKQSYRPVITKGFKAAPDLTATELTQIFSARTASDLYKKLQKEEWTEIEQSWLELRKDFVCRSITHRFLPILRTMAIDGVRLLRRILRPAGIVIAVIGPDGSGKSTVAERAVVSLRNTFSPGKMLQVHWKPVVFLKEKRKPTGKPIVDPHKNPPRNRIFSLIYLFGHWIEFLIGSHLYFRKATFKNGLVLVDRYHYDFLVDQRRYRMKVPSWVVKTLFALVKNPDLVFLFDAPAEVLQSRKREVSYAETARQAHEYRELLRKIPQGVLLDATRPIDDVARDMTRAVLDYLSKRTRTRFPS